jgi:hypothetical protein
MGEPVRWWCPGLAADLGGDGEELSLGKVSEALDGGRIAVTDLEDSLLRRKIVATCLTAWTAQERLGRRRRRRRFGHRGWRQLNGFDGWL